MQAWSNYLLLQNNTGQGQDRSRSMNNNSRDSLMFKKINHIGGVTDDKEILFSTFFDYFFPEAARSRLCRLPETETTVAGLKRLGDLMADPGEIGNAQPDFDSTIPAAYTYFGQFIDHDITARTDREGAVSILGNAEPIVPVVPVVPVDPDQVVANLRNGRRPQLDMDNLFGDGPAVWRWAGAGRGDYGCPHAITVAL